VSISLNYAIRLVTVEFRVCGCAEYAKSFGASTWGKIKDGEKDAKEAWEKSKEEKTEEKKDEL